MHKIKEKLESALALFNISSDIKTNNEKRAEIKKILQEIREIYEIFPVGGILERNQVICEEKVFYEQKFMESLQYINNLEENTLSQEQIHITTNLTHNLPKASSKRKSQINKTENYDIDYDNKLCNSSFQEKSFNDPSNKIYREIHNNNKKTKSIYNDINFDENYKGSKRKKELSLQAKTLHEENSHLRKLHKEKSIVLTELEQRLKESLQDNQLVFTKNCEINKNLIEKESTKEYLLEKQKELLRKIEINKIKLFSYESKSNLLENINREAFKYTKQLSEENEKLMKQNNEQLAFYETQLQNSIKNEVFLHDQELSNTSNRISTTKKISFLGSFHRNNLNTSDFQYFHNSDFRSLDQKSIHSSIIQSRLLSLKSSYKNTLKHNKQKLTLKHRRNKTETLLFSNNETFLQQPLVTVNSLLEISPLLEEKESLEMDFFLNFEGDGDWKKKLKKMESLLQEKKNKEKEELNKTRGSLIIKKKTSLEKVANGKLSTCERCNLF